MKKKLNPIFDQFLIFKLNSNFQNSAAVGGVAIKTYANSSNAANNLSRQSNSAPVPSQNNQLYSRPTSSTSTHNQFYPNEQLQQHQQHVQKHFGVKNPIIMRNADKQSNPGTQVFI